MSGEQYCDKCDCEYDGYNKHVCKADIDVAKLAEAHYGYTGAVVELANPHLSPEVLALCEYLYVQAFRHGWKHCEEA